MGWRFSARRRVCAPGIAEEAKLGIPSAHAEGWGVGGELAGLCWDPSALWETTVVRDPLSILVGFGRGLACRSHMHDLCVLFVFFFLRNLAD